MSNKDLLKPFVIVANKKELTDKEDIDLDNPIPKDVLIEFNDILMRIKMFNKDLLKPIVIDANKKKLTTEQIAKTLNELKDILNRKKMSNKDLLKPIVIDANKKKLTEKKDIDLESPMVKTLLAFDDYLMNFDKV